MQVDVNYVSVIVGAVVAIVLGTVWFGPLFGKTWTKLMNLDTSRMNSSGMWKLYLIQTIGSLLMSYVLYHTLVFGVEYTGTGGVAGGIMVGIWSWLGFVAPVTAGSVLWEGKPWKLWMITSGYYLITLILIGIIHSAFI